MTEPLQARLIAGGKWHDIDFARVELLKLLGEHPEVRTRVCEDYSESETLAEVDFLVTYTCDVRPSEEEQKALEAFLHGGKRWLALHGTNSVMDFLPGGVTAPRSHPTLMRLLGSQFVAHPPIGFFRVDVAQPAHPLVQGIAPFEIEDELYLCEMHGEPEMLLTTRYTGKAPGFAESDWPNDEPRPVMYLNAVGDGCVLYNTLGHCRGPYDMRPMIEVYPQTERCAWESPIYYELLRRGIRWAMNR